MGDIHRNIVRSPEELADLANSGDQITPYWDPRLRTSSSERWAFFKQLWSLGLLSFRFSVQAVVGLFFVRKKTLGAIRMVVDARMANQMHLPPEHIALGSAGPYAQLDLSLDAVQDGVGEIFEYSPHANEPDVQDCFWNFSRDEVASYFGIDELVSVRWLRERGFVVYYIYQEGGLPPVKATDDMWLYPVVRAMPMGWSWAMFFATVVVRQMVSESLEESFRGRAHAFAQLLPDKMPSPQLSVGRQIGSVYVDNVAMIGANRPDTNHFADAVAIVAKKKRLAVGLDVGYCSSEVGVCRPRPRPSQAEVHKQAGTSLAFLCCHQRLLGTTKDAGRPDASMVGSCRLLMWSQT